MKIISPHQHPAQYIYESIIDLNATPLWREYFPNNAAEMNYAHVVCRNNNIAPHPETPPTILLYSLSYGENGLQREFNFGKLLVELKGNYDLWSLLFLCSTYLPMHGNVNMRTFINEYALPENPNPIETILDCSYGKLVYHFQLEQLYRAYTGSIYWDEAIKFRKAFNKKDHAVIDAVLAMQLPDGAVFREFINQHRISDFVFKPLWEAAGKLLELLRFLGRAKL